MENKNFLAAVYGHIDKFWTNSEKNEFSWVSDQLNRIPPGFFVCQIRPDRQDNMWLYLTVGLSQTHTKNNEHIEFFILSPKEDSIHIETLTMLASFHADPNYGVYLGKVINIGRPWLEKSICTYFLTSLPYPFGPDFEWIKMGEGNIRILWLLPITPNEAQFVQLHGQDRLEKKFEELEINFLDPDRPSVV